MICQACREQGLRSSVTIRGSFRTALGYRPYYDEEGVLHQHDPNGVTREYECSLGHSWSEKEYPSCPSCGWTNEKKVRGERTLGLTGARD